LIVLFFPETSGGDLGINALCIAIAIGFGLVHHALGPSFIFLSRFMAGGFPNFSPMCFRLHQGILSSDVML
jgi:hypothetical protein